MFFHTKNQPGYTSGWARFHKCRAPRVLLLILVLIQSALADTISEEIPKKGVVSSSPPFQVVLMVNNRQNPFWKLAEDAGIKAAQDLNIELQVIDIQDNPLRPVRALSALVNSNMKPDAVLFPNIKNTGKGILELLEKHKIYSIIYDNGFSPKDNIGEPGQFYRYWLGEIIIRNYEASQSLTHEVIKEALQRFPDIRPIQMVIFDGNTSSRASSQRLLGMFDALISYPGQVEVKQIFHTRYSPEHAYTATLSTRQRYPKTRIIWSANDAMALKSLEALKEAGATPGDDVLIASFDLLPQSQDKIKNGELFNSYGGHYLSSAWGLIYLYDMFQGVTPRYQQLKISLRSGKLPSALPLSDIDFSRYSRFLNPPAHPDRYRKYHFELDPNHQ